MQSVHFPISKPVRRSIFPKRTFHCGNLCIYSISPILFFKFMCIFSNKYEIVKSKKHIKSFGPNYLINRTVR